MGERMKVEGGGWKEGDWGFHPSSLLLLPSSFGLVLPVVGRILEEGAELLFIHRLLVSLFGRNFAGAQQLGDGVVQRLIALLFADLHHAGNLVGLRFADEVGDR